MAETRRKNLIYAQVVRTSLSGFLLVCLPGARRMRLVLSFVISLLYALAIADGCVEINQCVGMIQHECAVKFDFHTGCGKSRTQGDRGAAAVAASCRVVWSNS